MSDQQAELRKRWRKHHEEHAEWAKAFRENGYPCRWPPSPPFPEELRGLTCGAKTRAGTPCKRTDIYRSGRCKFHGGLSTGPRPKTPQNDQTTSKPHEGLVKVDLADTTTGSTEGTR